MLHQILTPPPPSLPSALIIIIIIVNHPRSPLNARSNSSFPRIHYRILSHLLFVRNVNAINDGHATATATAAAAVTGAVTVDTIDVVRAVVEIRDFVDPRQTAGRACAAGAAGGSRELF